jgi:hypothetical protein
MADRITSRTWTEADIHCLRDVAEEGASILRAAAPLNRKTTSVAKVAKIHKLLLAGTRKMKVIIRMRDALLLWSRY